MILNEHKPDTYFAPAERMSEKQLEELISCIINEPVLHTVLKTIDGFVVLLNSERQILAANKNILDAIGVDLAEIQGKRPGEALNCIHYQEGPGGCGTSRHCANCGAVLTILASQAGNKSVDGECWLTKRVGDSFEAAEFRVRSTPVDIASRKIWAFVLNDISSSKRKEALERVFIHDLMNTLGGLLGYIELLEIGKQDILLSSAGKISKLVRRLHSEITSHRVLLEAERGELKLKPVRTSADQILSALDTIFMEHELAKGRKVNIKIPDFGNYFTVDEALLLRVLSNMLVNALEAAEPDGEVNVWFENNYEGCTFFVQNQGVIPENTALQIFQRSFSTKGGAGRGLGTYSMKLFGENFLHGKVDFRSTREEGTVFYITLPVNHSGAF